MGRKLVEKERKESVNVALVKQLTFSLFSIMKLQAALIFSGFDVLDMNI